MDYGMFPHGTPKRLTRLRVSAHFREKNGDRAAKKINTACLTWNNAGKRPCGSVVCMYRYLYLRPRSPTHRLTVERSVAAVPSGTSVKLPLTPTICTALPR